MNYHINMNLHRTILVLLLGILLTVNGCVVLPIPTGEDKVLAGTPVSEKQLAFLAPHVTTRQQVVEHLGKPNLIWEDARIFAYRWEMRKGILIWAVFAGKPIGDAGKRDLEKHYLLLIQFDEHDRVQRFERTVRQGSQSYIDFLKEWRSKSSGEKNTR